jgi:deazaflavin-dependent oxidoreductase (nitroreductase family)
MPSSASSWAGWPALGSDPRCAESVSFYPTYDPAVAATFRQTPLRRFFNMLITPLARLGLAGKRTHVLTVVGRKSGRRYSTPVQLVFHDGGRWLVAPYGERPWVRNARAAGKVELTRALRTERAPIEEVDAQTAAPILREYLRKTPVTKPYFDAKPDSALDDFAAEASRHPVFRLKA